jgi:hypothetical protein
MGSFSMTASCHPLPRNVVEEMLQLVGRAICDRPGETAAQREGRTNQMVHSTLGFAPRDGLEFMLAGLAIGHFNLILDSMRDVFRGQLVDQLKAKTKTTIVALDRAMLEMIKELRVESLRPVAQSLGDAVAAPCRPCPKIRNRLRQQQTVPARLTPQWQTPSLSHPQSGKSLRTLHQPRHPARSNLVTRMQTSRRQQRSILCQVRAGHPPTSTRALTFQSLPTKTRQPFSGVS